MTLELSARALVAGRYRLDAKLGEGGMGTVWAATHTVTLKRYALKFLKGPSTQRDDLRRRFLREARAASAVAHPNVVAIHDIFEVDGDTPVMVMDLLEGRTLGAILREKRQLSLSEIARLLLPAISAVGTAHALGIVHRDLKPDNIFVSPADRGGVHVRVLDFGIAKLMAQEGGGADTGSLTGTGALLGTPCYMSPEQGFGVEDVDHRTDVWAFGVILFEALAGARPVDGENRGQVLQRLLTSRITPIETLVPDLPEEIASLVGRMLARERTDRPEDLREVLEALRPHAGVDTPDFGPPSQLRSDPALPEPAIGPVQIRVDGNRVDPHRDTTPLEPARSGDTAAPLSVSAAVLRRARRNLAWLGAGVVALAAIAVIWAVSARSERASAAPTPSSVAAERASSPESPAAATPGAAPASSAPAVPVLASSAEESKTTRPDVVRDPSSRAARRPSTDASKPRLAGAKPPTSSTGPVGAAPPRASTEPPTKSPDLRREDGLVDDPPF